MTQINENIKIQDAVIFFPRSRQVLRLYGMEDMEKEAITLKKACEICQVDFLELQAEILRNEEEFLFTYEQVAS